MVSLSPATALAYESGEATLRRNIGYHFLKLSHHPIETVTCLPLDSIIRDTRANASFLSVHDQLTHSLQET